MGSLDTRLHELEARVAALEAGGPSPVCRITHGEPAMCLPCRECVERDGPCPLAGGPEPAASHSLRTQQGDEDLSGAAATVPAAAPAPAQAAQPAPQQPRYCHACLHMEVRGSQPPCRTCMPYPERPGWQPRGGGGAL